MLKGFAYKLHYIVNSPPHILRYFCKVRLKSNQLLKRVYVFLQSNPSVDLEILAMQPSAALKNRYFEKSYVFKTIFCRTYLNTPCLRFNIILTPDCNWAQ